jgi:acyl-CoA thioesterase
MSSKDKSAKQIVDTMLARDKFSDWLGLQVASVAPGYCKLNYSVREDMLNGFLSVHGGVLFSAADSALAFASATHGRVAVALDVSITFTKPAQAGDILTVEAKELHLGNKIAVYDIQTRNQRDELVAVFKGTVYRTERTVVGD